MNDPRPRQPPKPFVTYYVTNDWGRMTTCHLISDKCEGGEEA